VSWEQYAALIAPSLFYLAMITMAMWESTKPLKKMTKEEIEDHEYNRVIIDYDALTISSDASEVNV